MPVSSQKNQLTVWGQSPILPTLERASINTSMKLPHEKLGISELAYNLAYSQGYRDGFSKPNTSYRRGTALRRAYDKGRRDARRIS